MSEAVSQRVEVKTHPLDAIGEKYNSLQVITVTADANYGYKATLEAFEKINGEWQAVLQKIPAVVGKNGVGKQKEGDKKAPTGIFTLGTAFGSAGPLPGLKIPYRQTTEYDYWVDDSNSPEYNQWVTYKGEPKQRWSSFERLRIPLYKYALVINYNEEAIPGKGSAIFLHIWPGADKPTLGCTAISEQNLVELLLWLDPDNNPIIIQGTNEDIQNMLNQQ